MSRRETILEKIQSIPAIPASASQVMQLLNDPDFEMEDIIKVIEYDHVATANLLKLANSAYFGRGSHVTTVRDAVVRMGAQRTGQLMMVASVGPISGRPLEGYDLPPGELWRHSVAVAIATDLLSRELNLRAPAYAFTAGLLHDIGKVVLDVFVRVDAEPIKGLAMMENLTFEMAERQVLGIDHPEVGAVLLSTWGIPDTLSDAVRWHHDPDKAPEFSPAIDLVHAADRVVSRAGIGLGIDAPYYEPVTKAFERLSAREADMEAVIEKLDAEMEAVEELFAMTSAH